MRLRCALVICWSLACSLILWLNLSGLYHDVPAASDAGQDPSFSGSSGGPPAPGAALAAQKARVSRSLGSTSNTFVDTPQRAPPSADSCPESCPGEKPCCWEVRNRVLRAVFIEHPWPQWYAFESHFVDDSTKHALPIHGAPLFQLMAGSASRNRESAGAMDCHLVGTPQASKLNLSMRVSCSHGVEAEFIATLRSQTSHYLRTKVNIWSTDGGMASKSGKWPRDSFGILRLLSFSGLSRVAETRDAPQDNDEDFPPLDGLPILMEDRFFVAVEHPLAVMLAGRGANATHWQDVMGQLTHLGRLARPTASSPWTYGTVLGTFSEMSQARRAFVSYIHTERPGRRSPMVHYNSWYDFYSYQDEGFNGGFKDQIKNPKLIEILRKDKLSEENCLERVHSIGRELVEKRGTKLHSFLWDDGWDNTKSLWEFDEERFPQRFDKIAESAKTFGAGIGVWLSPWGGYGFPQENRVKYGKSHGFETNWNANMEAEAFSLAGPNYRKVFKDTALKFRREQGVNMYKFDGVAGDPRELAIEMEAMLGLLAELRTATTSKGDGQAKKTERKKEEKELAKEKGEAEEEEEEEEEEGDEDDDDEVWINLTTGTWASPFFLLWADSIWRGGPDIPSRRRDWEPDFERSLLKAFPDLTWADLPPDGLTRRQRWIRWRNLVMQLLVVSRSHFFPISQLMIHGVIVSSHGDALHWGLNTFDEIDFTQEVWSFVALGLQLQELYVAPRFMTAAAWDILAEGLKWSAQEAEVLRDSHWAFGETREREVYCVASWDVASVRGFLFVHNPTGKLQLSDKFSLASALELPAAQQELRLQLKLVKSASRPKAAPDAKQQLAARSAGAGSSSASDEEDEADESAEAAAVAAAAKGSGTASFAHQSRFKPSPEKCDISLPSASLVDASSSDGQLSCLIAAEEDVQIRLLPTEVLVLEVSR